MLVRVGWKPDFVEKSVPILPISGWMGDNLIKKSEKMTWWSGCDALAQDGAKIHIDTLLDALNTFVQVPACWLLAAAAAVVLHGRRSCCCGAVPTPTPLLPVAGARAQA